MNGIWKNTMSGNYLYNAKDISRRLLGDMKDVLEDAAAAENRENEVFYTVYRNIEVVEGKARYDITEIPPGRVSKEFNKTFGHYHKKPLPEIYEVLEGHAYFLIQKMGADPSEISEAYVIEALSGEKAVIPPGYGHLAVNVGNTMLKLANWMGLSDYDYETIRQFGGGCYYILDYGNSIEFERNKKYKTVPGLYKIKLKNSPQLEELGIKKEPGHPILSLKKHPEKLDWLSDTEKYLEILTVDKLYRRL